MVNPGGTLPTVYKMLTHFDTSTCQRGRPFETPTELKPACLFTIFSSGYTPVYIFAFGIMKRI
ncbi:TPA: hypothetical protein ACHYL2_005202, partial [Escherichia coli]